MNLSTRGMRVLCATTIVGCALLAGTAVGGLRISRSRTRPSELRPLVVGSILPAAAVISDSGRGVDLHSLLSERVPTVLILFTTGCQSCLGQIEAWERLARRVGTNRSMLALVCAPNLSSLRQLRVTQRLTIDAWFCDAKLRYDLHMVSSPTIYEVLPRSGEIMFQSIGDSATTRLLEHLSRFAGGMSDAAASRRY